MGSAGPDLRPADWRRGERGVLSAPAYTVAQTGPWPCNLAPGLENVVFAAAERIVGPTR